MVSKSACTVPQPPRSVFNLALSAEEQRYFEWFEYRTVKKIRGAFVLTFWDTLLFQASLKEPAVLHAVLTLSSVHKRETLDENSQECEEVPDEQEQFMMQHYIKAISHLQPHFLSKDRPSIRVALITCVVFICLELLRGRFKTAHTHLQNGLKVLAEMQNPLSLKGDGILILKPSRESVDDWIAEAFSRLHIQVMLFKQNLKYEYPCLIHQDIHLKSTRLMYHSLNEAWTQIERILNNIFHLARQARRQLVIEILPPGCPSAPYGHQQRIKAELAQWLDTFEASKKDLQSKESVAFESQVLYTFHSIANIMAEICLRPYDESLFDSYTPQFVSMISQLANSWKAKASRSQVPSMPGHRMNMSRSVIDIGWIPPLYYIAMKCRVHRIRLQAIRLLESTSHREGIWDSIIAARVARKVMEMEERDFYKNIATADDFPLSSSPGSEDLSLPILPQSYRLHEVKVELSDGPMENILLFYKQQQTNGDWKVLSKEYDIVSQCWIDGRIDETENTLLS